MHIYVMIEAFKLLMLDMGRLKFEINLKKCY